MSLLLLFGGAPSGPANISCAMQNGCELVVTADGGTPPVVSYAACDLVNAQVTDAGPISAVMAACAMVNRSELEAAPYAQQGVLYTGASLISGARLRARALRAAQLEDLPPTDDLGWTLPDAAPSPLWDLSVTIGTFRVPNALITNLTIDLDDHCGYESCAISFASRRARRWPSRAQIVVAYDSQNLFEGRLKTQRRNIGTELGWSLEFVGNLNALRDHRAFRRVYADSDLENWRLDQPGGSAGSGD